MAHEQDIDPILAQEFCNFLFPIVFPEVELNSDIYRFTLEKLVKEHRLISVGSLLEVAISKKKNLQRHDTKGRDFVDGSDAKCASARWHRKGQGYGAPITNIFNKEGLLRCQVYERQLNKFYFFLIPREAYAHISKSSNIDIPFNLDGTPFRNSKVHNINWWDFEVADFDGILGDVAPTFVNHRQHRLEKKAAVELKKAATKLRRQEKLEALRLKNLLKEQRKTANESLLDQCLSA